MPKAFLLTHKRYDLYNLNIPRIWKGQEEEDGENELENETTTTHRFLGQRVSEHQHRKKFRWGNYEEDENKNRVCTDQVKGQEFIRDWKSSAASVLNRENYHAADMAMEVSEDEPVNLSIKKIDLFNLTQLAEVSLARASRILPIDHSSRGSSSESCEENLSTSSVNTKTEKSNEEEAQTKVEILDEDETSCCSSSSSSAVLRQVCAECGKGFSTLSNLARHRQTHRSTEDSSAVKKCPHCDKAYVSIPAFSMHLRTHNQGCKCPYCGKGFSRPWLLQGHIRTHTGEKPFKCSICGKAFADKSNLRAHTQTHSTEKPFICSRCGKTFALKSYLCKHIESSCMRTNRGHGMPSGGGKTSPHAHADEQNDQDKDTL